MNRPFRIAGASLAVFLVSGVSAVSAQEAPGGGPFLGKPVPAVSIDVDLRALPRSRAWEPGDPIREVPKRRYPKPGYVPPPESALRTGPDPLLAVQERSAESEMRAFETPVLDFAAAGFTGVNPPDTVGDVGPSHYIHMVNSSGGSEVRIYNKSGVLLAGPFALDGLGAPAPCNSGFGDPIVLHDQLADRWLLAEFAGSGANMCVYVSKTADPVAGGWWFYRFTTPNFPDYPKFGVWPDAYYMTTNEPGLPPAYAFDRENMLNGAVARPFQRFTASTGLAFPFEAMTPADLDGPNPPPPGAPGIFARHRDDEVHGGSAAADFIDLWEFRVNWDTPGSSSFTQLPSVPVADFSSELCGLSSFNCFPQQGSTVTLDPLREVIMFRLSYRNFGSHQRLHGNFVVDADGEGGGDPLERGGIRWFVLADLPHKEGRPRWGLGQEGTFSPDTNARWMAASAMSGIGDIAVGYSVTSSTMFPSLRFTGREASDAPGTLRAETNFATGTAANGSIRWGDYAAMSVDPVDDCTFWFTSMYSPASTWSTRVGVFRFDSCSPVPAPADQPSAEAAPGPDRRTSSRR